MELAGGVLGILGERGAAHQNSAVDEQEVFAGVLGLRGDAGHGIKDCSEGCRVAQQQGVGIVPEVVAAFGHGHGVAGAGVALAEAVNHAAGAVDGNRHGVGGGGVVGQAIGIEQGAGSGVAKICHSGSQAAGPGIFTGKLHGELAAEAGEVGYLVAIELEELNLGQGAEMFGQQNSHTAAGLLITRPEHDVVLLVSIEDAAEHVGGESGRDGSVIGHGLVPRAVSEVDCTDGRRCGIDGKILAINVPHGSGVVEQSAVHRRFFMITG